MQMDMEDTLSGGFPNVHADVIPIRMEFLVQNPLHFIDHIKHVFPLILR